MYFSFPFLRELLEFMFFLFITHCCFTQGLDRPQPHFSSIYIYSFFFPLLCFFYSVCNTMLHALCSYPNISCSSTLKDNSICHFIPIIIFLLWWQLRHLIKENLNVLSSEKSFQSYPQWKHCLQLQRYGSNLSVHQLMNG